MWERVRGRLSCFVFVPHALMIQDLSEAEKMDHFIRALVPEVRLQVELRGPINFHEAAMYAEHADAVICVSLAKTHVNHGRKVKRGSSTTSTNARYHQEWKPVHQVHQVLNQWNLGMAQRRTLSKEEYQKLRSENACFYCRKPNAGTCCV